MSIEKGEIEMEFIDVGEPLGAMVEEPIDLSQHRNNQSATALDSLKAFTDVLHKWADIVNHVDDNLHSSIETQERNSSNFKHATSPYEAAIESDARDTTVRDEEHKNNEAVANIDEGNDDKDAGVIFSIEVAVDAYFFVYIPSFCKCSGATDDCRAGSGSS